MSQPLSQSQEATAEIIRAANIDGPDKLWPELVPKLNFFAIFDDNGHWDLQFEPSAGVKTMNVMTPSNVCPGAMMYFGTKDGIRKAFLTALFLSNAEHVLFKVVNVSPLFRPVNPFSCTAYLHLRVADTHEYTQPRDDSPTSPLESSGQLAVFILPYREEPESAAGGYKVETKVLVLEEVPRGTNKWGVQLGQIKVAQMNGVGQHVFFGRFEAV